MPRKIVFGLLSVGLFLAFMLFSYLVAKETFTQIDFDTTVKFQDRIPRKLDYPFSILSVLGTAEVTGLICLVLLIFLLLKRFWVATISLFLLPLALFMEVFGKLYVLHPGPPHFMYRGLIQFDLPSHYVAVHYSYPSGHMLRTSFLAVFIIGYLFLRKSHHTYIIGIPLLLGLIGIMFISRIYLGEHWLSDVIGGTLLGSSFGLLAAITVPNKKINTLPSKG